MVKYTALSDRNGIFSARYKLYLPDKEELKVKLMQDREIVEQERRLMS